MSRLTVGFDGSGGRYFSLNFQTRFKVHFLNVFFNIFIKVGKVFNDVSNKGQFLILIFKMVIAIFIFSELVFDFLIKSIVLLQR